MSNNIKQQSDSEDDYEDIPVPTKDVSPAINDYEISDKIATINDFEI